MWIAWLFRWTRAQPVEMWSCKWDVSGDVLPSAFWYDSTTHGVEGDSCCDWQVGRYQRWIGCEIFLGPGVQLLIIVLYPWSTRLKEIEVRAQGVKKSGLIFSLCVWISPVVWSFIETLYADRKALEIKICLGKFWYVYKASGKSWEALAQTVLGERGILDLALSIPSLYLFILLSRLCLFVLDLRFVCFKLLIYHSLSLLAYHCAGCWPGSSLVLMHHRLMLYVLDSETTEANN